MACSFSLYFLQCGNETLIRKDRLARSKLGNYMAYPSQTQALLPFCQWTMRRYCFPELAQLYWLTKKILRWYFLFDYQKISLNRIVLSVYKSVFHLIGHNIVCRDQMNRWLSLELNPGPSVWGGSAHHHLVLYHTMWFKDLLILMSLNSTDMLWIQQNTWFLIVPSVHAIHDEVIVIKCLR